jgi:seryl-tRNA synthetase
MLDMNLIRQNPGRVKDGLLSRGEDASTVDRILEADRQWRAVVAQSEELKAERNRQSKRIGKLLAGDERERLVLRMRQVGDRVKELDASAAAQRASLDELLLKVPNLPQEAVPVGQDETQNVIVRAEGRMPQFDFEPQPHWELGPRLGILDFERGARMSGSRFYVLMREGARLQRALINWMLDLHTSRHGYTEVYPPFVVRRESLLATGHLPKFEDNLYRDVEDDLWLIPTGEAPLVNLHRDEILAEEQLPKRYVAYTACFRREKMSAGKDVRGIKRGHQFDKVEMVKFTAPGASEGELAGLVADAEDVCRLLGLAYRVKELCTADLAFQACRAFDIEVWAAGCGEWLEVSTCSNCGDFQARRAGIRYRPSGGAGPQFVHTLNGSGVALPRTMIAVVENNQQRDGSVLIPDVLRPYLSGLERIEAR